MKRNLSLTRGLIFSEAVLLALTDKGVGREDAYRIVQSAAADVWGTQKNFKEVLQANKDVSKTLSPAEVDELFDLERSIRHVDYIFQRTGL
jgi:adenylosuccinate lyase